MKTGYLVLEAKRAMRNPRFLFFTMVFPVVLFLVDAGTFGKERVDGTTVSYTAYLMCSMAAYGAFAAAMNSGARTALERAAGWQRQLRLTPLTPSGYLTAKAAVGFMVALPPVFLVSVVGGLVEGVHLTPAGWMQAVLGVWAATLPFAVLGLLIGQLATSETVQVLTVGVTMLFGFLGGIFIPSAVFPDWLNIVSKALPSYWLAEIGHGAALGNHDTATAVAVLGAWTVVLAFAVTRRYRRDSARV
ncbi:MAG: ABC transporter permease [Kutzneria sp.]|nr:ABC transporter permease [Kutzneria sp.]MBV9845516.1 ABC transporter permease [Kutzneria sp.]